MEPENRREYYYAAIAGEAVNVPDPITRMEYYLKKIGERIDRCPLIVNSVSSNGVATLDRTWEEIHDAGLAVIKTTGLLELRETWIVQRVYVRSGSDYRVVAVRTGDGDEEPNEKRIYKATARDGYPSLSLT